MKEQPDIEPALGEIERWVKRPARTVDSRLASMLPERPPPRRRPLLALAAALAIVALAAVALFLRPARFEAPTTEQAGREAVVEVPATVLMVPLSTGTRLYVPLDQLAGGPTNEPGKRPQG